VTTDEPSVIDWKEQARKRLSDAMDAFIDMDFAKLAMAKERAERKQAHAEKALISVNARLDRAVRDRADLIARQAADHESAKEAHRLLEFALHLRMHGENAPGGTETWAQFDREVEHFLRWGAGGSEVPQVSGVLFGLDACAEWLHGGSCSWPEMRCTGHMPSYSPVRVPENTGKHPAGSDETPANPDIKCREPSCPNFGDPDFGEGACPSEHVDPR
jgi:hypothetical protein